MSANGPHGAAGQEKGQVMKHHKEYICEHRDNYTYLLGILKIGLSEEYNPKLKVREEIFGLVNEAKSGSVGDFKSGSGVKKSLNNDKIKEKNDKPNNARKNWSRAFLKSKAVAKMKRPLHTQGDYMNVAKSMFSMTQVGAAQLEDLQKKQEDGIKVCTAEVTDSPLAQSAEKNEDQLKVVGLDAMGIEQYDFHRVNVSGETSVTCNDRDYKIASGMILDALSFRSKYMKMANQTFNPTTAKYLARVEGREDPLPHPAATPVCPYTDNNEKCPYDGNWKAGLLPNLGWSWKMKNGMIEVYENKEDMERGERILDYDYPDTKEFCEDQCIVMAMMASGQCKTFCYQRLQFLDAKWRLHDLLNGPMEKKAQQKCPHRDFYNCRKVDTHIHASACMNQKHLLKYIKSSLEKEGNVQVCKKDGKTLTLNEVFKSLDMNAYDLTVDSLDCHADKNIYHRFDNFNAKYNPMGVGLLREIYIKTNNFIGGRYFAEIIKQVMKDLEDQKYVMAELRLSVYGCKFSEFEDLAKWAIDQKVYSNNVRWLIQVPRIFDIFKKTGAVRHFGDYLNNVFGPVMEASINPQGHPELAKFLEHVSGFDSVDDESKPENHFFSAETPTPEEWTTTMNPPYSYYLWYMYANITMINQVRKERGLNTFNLRPHCGEAGAYHHLCTSFLLAENIAHGLQLKKVPVIEYLYYLGQVGICMSPLSNNHLFLDYRRSPMEAYLRRGLNISLSTDDPLQFHFTKEALMEEYSIAAQVFKLTGVDMCEISRNSVYHSGYDEGTKAYWLGDRFQREGVDGNDPRKTNVPDIRLQYRHETLSAELQTSLEPFMPTARRF